MEEEKNEESDEEEKHEQESHQNVPKTHLHVQTNLAQSPPEIQIDANDPNFVVVEQLKQIAEKKDKDNANMERTQ